MSSPRYALRWRAKAGRDFTLFSVAAHLSLAQHRAARLRGIAGLAQTPDGARHEFAVVANSVVRGVRYRDAATGAAGLLHRFPAHRRARFASRLFGGSSLRCAAAFASRRD